MFRHCVVISGLIVVEAFRIDMSLVTASIVPLDPEVEPVQAGGSETVSKLRIIPPPVLERQPLPPRDALHALLHTPLTVSLTDGRRITGTLSAVDKYSLLLSQAKETRILEGDIGRNVAAYYPFSKDDGRQGGQGQELGEGAGVGSERERKDSSELVRERDVSSVLVRFEHVTKVEIDEESAEAWGRFAGVEFEDGVAVV